MKYTMLHSSVFGSLLVVVEMGSSRSCRNRWHDTVSEALDKASSGRFCDGGISSSEAMFVTGYFIEM